MRYLLFISVFLWNALTVLAQDSSTFTSNLNYGVSGYVTMATGINDNATTYGVGGDLFAAYRIAPRNYVQSKLGYKRYSYEYNDLTQKRTMEDIHLRLAVKHSLNEEKGIRVLLGYEPAYIINAQNTYLGYLDSLPSTYFQKQLTNRLSHSLYAGLEFQSKHNGSIDIGYSYTLNKTTTNEYYDAIPNHFTVAYNFRFNTNKVISPEVLQAKATLKKLGQDTLYFINRGCSEDYSFDQLDSLLSKNYSYSAYRLLQDNEIAQVSNQPNVVHFAIIGQHYGSTSDPLSSGIYLLDSKLKSTEFPYPYHTTNPKNSNGFSLCFGGLGNTAALISTFDQRLKKKFFEL